MMATTHALFGVALAAVTLFYAPEHAPAAAAAGLAGGVFPDLDIAAAHRKTLHFPVYYSTLAAVASVLALAAPGTWTVAVAFFLLAAAVHSAMDALGGGLELKPWLGESERAVYDHYHGRWLRPRRWVRYDGAPEDLLVAAMVATPGLVLYAGSIRTLIVVVLAVSAAYALVRKQLPRLGKRLFDRLPADVLAYVPEALLV